MTPLYLDAERMLAIAEELRKQIPLVSSDAARSMIDAAGKRMPVDADTVEPDDDEFDSGRHESHFASCSAANQHRRPR